MDMDTEFLIIIVVQSMNSSHKLYARKKITIKSPTAILFS